MPLAWGVASGGFGPYLAPFGVGVACGGPSQGAGQGPVCISHDSCLALEGCGAVLGLLPRALRACCVEEVIPYVGSPPPHSVSASVSASVPVSVSVSVAVSVSVSVSASVSVSVSVSASVSASVAVSVSFGVAWCVSRWLGWFWFGLVWFVVVCFGLLWFGLVWLGLVGFAFGFCFCPVVCVWGVPGARGQTGNT